MLTTIFSAILFTTLFKGTSGVPAANVPTKAMYMRGGIIGALLALAIGYFTPSSSSRLATLDPINVQKTMEKTTFSPNGKTVFKALVMNDKRQLQPISIAQDDMAITVTDATTGPVKMYKCYNSFADAQTWLWAIRIPSYSYELEVPTSMASSITLPDTDNSTTVLYSEDLSQPKLADAK